MKKCYPDPFSGAPSLELHDAIEEYHSYKKSLPESQGRTLLHSAAAKGHLELVKLIVQNSMTANNPEDVHGLTPLHFASQGGHLNVVKFLLQFLDDKNPKAGAHWNGNTVLHSAAFTGQLHIIEYLLDQIDGDINPPQSDGATVLHTAAEGGQLNVVTFYTSQLSNPNPGRLSNDRFRGRTPLHMAAEKGHLAVVQHLCNLLEDKNPKDSNDYTPLHLAASFGHLEVVKYLLQHVEDRHPKSGEVYGNITPLDVARMRHNFEIVRYFLHRDSIENMRQRQAAKTTKASKHVKNVTVTQGSNEEYNIDNVLQSLGINDEVEKEKPKSKKKKKKAKVAREVTKPEPTLKGAEGVIDSSPDVHDVVEVKKADECTICFDTRIQTYMFYPCGHATFCKNCALHLFNNSERKCPDCRSLIKDTVRVYQ